MLVFPTAMMLKQSLIHGQVTRHTSLSFFKFLINFFNHLWMYVMSVFPEATCQKVPAKLLTSMLCLSSSLSSSSGSNATSQQELLTFYMQDSLCLVRLKYLIRIWVVFYWTNKTWWTCVQTKHEKKINTIFEFSLNICLYRNNSLDVFSLHA